MSVYKFLRRMWIDVCKNHRRKAHLVLAIGTLGSLCITLPQGYASDLAPRLWAMFLQLLGAYTAWLDLTSTADDFGVPSTESLRDYVKSKLSRFFKKNASAPGASLYGAVSATASFSAARLSSVLDPNQTLEIRVRHLEGFVRGLEDELVMVQTQLKDQGQELSNELRNKIFILQQSIESVELRLKNAFVGNYALLSFGGMWLFVGIVLSSVPSELAHFLHQQILPRLP